MIEALTPQVLATSMMLVLLVAPLLTALLSALGLWRYHGAVARLMTALARDRAQPDTASCEPRTAAPGADAKAGTQVPPETLLGRMTTGRRRAARFYAMAVFCGCLPFSLAAQWVYPSGLGIAGFAIGIWIYAWPALAGLVLMTPGSRRSLVIGIAVYLLIYIGLCSWAAGINNVPAMSFGEVHLPSRSGVTPLRMVSLWASVNAAPTLLALACFNQRLRSVAPLVLAMVTIFISGLWFTLLALDSPALPALLQQAGLDVELWYGRLVTASVIALPALFALAAWQAVRLIAQAYRRKLLSDRSLALDSLFLVFAAAYSMWLVVGGLSWLATLPLGFALYRGTLTLAHRAGAGPARPGIGLSFLRVFALGQRSQALLDAVTAHWRYIGSVQMICGPDVATGTAAPHQFLDYLSGQLRGHFIRDARDAGRALADREPDPDGRFRINSLFCYADSWQAALPALVGQGDVVLMDLRSFGPENAGCRLELEFLCARVPFSRCLLLVDPATNRRFLDQILAQAMAGVGDSSPNQGLSPAAAPIFILERGEQSLAELLAALCDAAVGRAP